MLTRKDDINCRTLDIKHKVLLKIRIWKLLTLSDEVNDLLSGVFEELSHVVSKYNYCVF